MPRGMMPSRYEVRRVVREALANEFQSGTAEARSEVVTVADLEARARAGQSLDFPEGTRFTMLAQESLSRLPARGTPREEPKGLREVVAIGGDHRGFEAKQALTRHLEGRGFAVVDCGAGDGEASDYPVLARRVAEAVASGSACAGVFVDGSGIGSAMAANKVAGVRAAHCRTEEEARAARDHNHAQMLTLNASTDDLPTIVDTFLRTPFGSGRHARRVELMEGGS